MLPALLALVLPAKAAGFHFLRAEAIAGASDGVPEGGVGASAISDALAGWITFGSPATDGHIVRAWRVSSSDLGPVIGVVPPLFRGLVRPHALPFALPWLHAHVGGDAATGKLVEADVSAHTLLNVPGFWGGDPRRAYLGPSAGLGLNGTWWEDWRATSAPGVVMTGKITGEGGLLGGVTLRDTWYAQGRAVAGVDLFGEHAWNVGVGAVTGVFLDRVGVPAGLEVRGQVDIGDDTASGAVEPAWSVRGALFWKLTPPFQTRIEQELEKKRRRADAR